jgi:hypothetical protein
MEYSFRKLRIVDLAIRVFVSSLSATAANLTHLDAENDELECYGSRSNPLRKPNLQDRRPILAGEQNAEPASQSAITFQSQAAGNFANVSMIVERIGKL